MKHCLCIYSSSVHSAHSTLINKIIKNYCIFPASLKALLIFLFWITVKSKWQKIETENTRQTLCIEYNEILLSLCVRLRSNIIHKSFEIGTKSSGHGLIKTFLRIVYITKQHGRNFHLYMILPVVIYLYGIKHGIRWVNELSIRS